MKLKLLTLTFTLLLSIPALAYVFTPPSRIITLPNRVSLEIINNNYRPIACAGEIVGYKPYGQQILPFYNIIVPAGAAMPVTLWAVGAPFVNSTYHLACNFMGW